MAEAGTAAPVLTARAAGLVGCRTCGQVSPAARRVCPRCGSALHSRMPASLQRVWAFLLAGMICYIPANLWPMLVTTRLGWRSESTIVGGVIELAQHGAWDLALVVGIASVLIPIGKFVVIAHLAYSVQYDVALSVPTRVHLYEVVEFIGRWSMIDVFVVAILADLVQFGFVASIRPGPAAAFFALSVIFTMLSAQALDPRLLWDTTERRAPAR